MLFSIISFDSEFDRLWSSFDTVVFRNVKALPIEIEWTRDSVITRKFSFRTRVKSIEKIFEEGGE